MPHSTCCVAGCANTSRNDDTVTFHRLPIGRLGMMNEWTTKLTKPGHTEATYTSNSRICNGHFKEDCFTFAKKSGRKSLKRNAVPQLFPWGEILQVSPNAIPTPRTKKKQFFSSFSIEDIRSNEKIMRRYTGFKSVDIYESLFSFFSRPLHKVSLIQCPMEQKSNPNPDTPTKKRGRLSKLTNDQQFFMTMIRLRRNIPVDVLADMFGISDTTASRIINTWIIVMSKLLRLTPIWRSKEDIMKNMPEKFSSFGQIRAILDCTEIELQTSSDKNIQKDTWSHYKQRNTVKGLVAISPDYQITFVSQIYCGSASDKKIVTHCGILDKFDSGDILMADRGFDIELECQEKGISLLIPNFLRKQNQFTPEQIERSREIARLRVLVENKIGCIKFFRILTHEIPLTLQPIVDHIWTVCNYLVNFMEPLKKDDNDMPDAIFFEEVGTATPTIPPRRATIRQIRLFPAVQLRNMKLPDNCIETFLHVAEENTENDIETCGLLVGIMDDDNYRITNIFLPKQTGDATSCVCSHEEEVLEFVAHMNLLTLGWIHTHPSLAAFLSSPDLHTQYAYQQLLPESIAIVCSSLYNENKIFSIKAGQGMDVIRNCNAAEYFHQHMSPEDIYEECTHVIMEPNFDTTIIDLRAI